MVDENVFFKNVTRLICGDLEIDKALKDCLDYIRAFIPADAMGFVIYLPEQKMFETIARADLAGADTRSVKFPADTFYQNRMKTDFSAPRITVAHPGDPEDYTLKFIRQAGWMDGLSAIMIEMVLTGKRMGALAMISKKQIRYEKKHIRLISLLNEPFGIALTNCLRYRKVKELKNRLLDDKRYLEKELFHVNIQEIVGSDGGLKGVMESVAQVAALNSPVLLLGETGVGKEVIAKAIHMASGRRSGPFIKVNCGAIPESLIDSELFGHEKGAFTGALSRKLGRFERAHLGTIFLDEIGELPLDAQTRLLRVLEDMEIERVGGDETVSIDSRVLAATNRDLDAMIKNRQFREDLYFRLKVFPIEIPPLRDRKTDIPALVHYFMHKKAKEIAFPGIPALALNSLPILMAYDWPGNIRELENAVERALITCRGMPLSFDDLATAIGPKKGMIAPKDTDVEATDGLSTLNAAAASHIRKALQKCRGRVEGPHGAAVLLDVHPATLRQKMRRLGVPFGRRHKHLYQKGC